MSAGVTWGTGEEQRAAATLRATLCGQLMAGAVAMIGILGAILVYCLTNGLWWVLIPALVAACLFVLGIIAGGVAVEHLARVIEQGLTDGADPKDRLAHAEFKKIKKRFLIGLVFLAVTVLAAAAPVNRKPSATEQLAGIEDRLRELVENGKHGLATQNATLQDALQRLSALETARDAAQRRIEVLEVEAANQKKASQKKP